MACDNALEAQEVGQQLSQVNNGSLITYRRADDILLNIPRGPVVLIVLAGDDAPQTIESTLLWIRRRLPRSQVAVVGNVGGGDLEMTARKGGAIFLSRPVTSQQWEALIKHVFHMQGQYVADMFS
jgi:hypothetical protein